MKVRLESATCEGFGTCAGHVPNLFDLDEWGYAMLKNDGEVPTGEDALARRAVLDCPVHAIIITDE